MTTKEVADGIVALCREGKFEDAQEKYFSKDAISIEPEDAPTPNGAPQQVHGLEKIKEKGKAFMDMVETAHEIKVSDPIIAGNRFSTALSIDATMKGKGRMNMEEIIVYKVKDGKVVQEEFFA